MKNLSIPYIALICTILLVSVLVGYYLFGKYQKLSSFSEVSIYLKKIYESATVYGDRSLRYNLKHQQKKQYFPNSTGLTPSIPCCNRQGEAQKCRPNGHGYTGYSIQEWDDPSWKKLGIKIIDPHLYRYRFINTTIKGSPGFKASAYGDLDCDGIESHYYRRGYLKKDHVIGEHEILSENPGE